MIIVIDGPAGSGKSSTAKAVAQKIGIAYLDSGALYRALTWLYVQTGQDKPAFFDVLNQTSLSFCFQNGRFRVQVDGQDITRQLRSDRITEAVSTVASFPRSRSFVNNSMRRAVEHGQYIAEGRDLGTAVFPEAELKFFLTADVEERSRRRFDELRQAGAQITFNEVLRNIQQRDEKDASRAADPLKKAEDAIEINTTDMSFEEQVQQICTIIDKKTVLTYN